MKSLIIGLVCLFLVMLLPFLIRSITDNDWFNTLVIQGVQHES